MSAPKPANEDQRLAALHRYQILDSGRESAFDDLALLASTICDTPIGLLTLIDADRQWFKAQVGIGGTETLREHAFCAHAILGTSTMIVKNALEDERFATNPYVTSDPNVRFYAGAPLIDRDGYALGTLCVIDRQPRELTPAQQAALKALSRQVISLMEFRRVSAELAQALSDLDVLQGLLPICSYCKSIRDEDDKWKTVEDYMCSHSPATFSHGICPSCLQRHFPEVVAARDTAN